MFCGVKEYEIAPNATGIGTNKLDRLYGPREYLSATTSTRRDRNLRGVRCDVVVMSEKPIAELGGF